MSAMNKCWSGCGKGGNCLWECKLMRSLRRRVHCYCSVTRLCLPLSPHELQHNRLSSAISLRLLKLMFIESVMPSNQLILCQPLLLLPSTFVASRSFPITRLFASGGQSVGASAAGSVFPMNIQG